MFNLQVKRGNKIDLPLEGLSGEPLVALDSAELFIGQGAALPVIKITDIIFADTAPLDVTKLWIDTVNDLVKRFNGTDWVKLSDSVTGTVAFADITGDVTDNTALDAALTLKADASTVYTKLEMDSTLALIPQAAEITASKGIVRIADDVQLDASVAGDGLILNNGVLSVSYDFGTF